MLEKMNTDNEENNKTKSNSPETEENLIDFQEILKREYENSIKKDISQLSKNMKNNSSSMIKNHYLNKNVTYEEIMKKKKFFEKNLKKNGKKKNNINLVNLSNKNKEEVIDILLFTNFEGQKNDNNNIIFSEETVDSLKK